MCLFRANGKVIKESGMAEMLYEANILASGSLNGVLDCTNFNRCKRLHPMLALAFEILHFKEFCGTLLNAEDLMADIKSFIKENIYNRDNLLDEEILSNLHENYSTYVE